MNVRLLKWEFHKLFRIRGIWEMLLLMLLLNIYISSPKRLAPIEWWEIRNTQSAVEEYDLTTIGSVLDAASLLTEELVEQAEIYADQPQEAFVLGEGTSTVSGMLFSVLCKALVLEGMMIGLMVVLFFFGVEQTERMEQMLYRTCAGRKITLVKLCACTLITAAGYLLLCGCSLLFFIYRWNVPAYFCSEMSSPYNGYTFSGSYVLYNTYIDMTVWQYLLAVLALGAFLCLVVMLAGYACMLLIRNIYAGTLVLAGFFLTNGVVYGVAGQGTFERIWRWTMVPEIMVLPGWFTDMAGTVCCRWQETAAAAVNAGLVLLLWMLSYRHFLNRDVTH